MQLSLSYWFDSQTHVIRLTQLSLTESHLTLNKFMQIQALLPRRETLDSEQWHLCLGLSMGRLRAAADTPGGTQWQMGLLCWHTRGMNHLWEFL